MSELKQEITLLSGIGQLSTTLMGTGLFMIPAIAASIAGQYSLWAWLFLFVLICPVALNLASATPTPVVRLILFAKRLINA